MDILVPPMGPRSGNAESGAVTAKADKRNGTVVLTSAGRRYTLSAEEADALCNQLMGALDDIGADDADDSEPDGDEAPAADDDDERKMLAIMIAPRLKRGD